MKKITLSALGSNSCGDIKELTVRDEKMGALAVFSLALPAWKKRK